MVFSWLERLIGGVFSGGEVVPFGGGGGDFIAFIYCVLLRGRVKWDWCVGIFLRFFVGWGVVLVVFLCLRLFFFVLYFFRVAKAGIAL